MSSVSTKIITNRQLNFTLSPVDTHNKKAMPHKLQNYEIDGVWNHHQSIILDAIIDNLFKRAYRKYKKLPQSWRSQKVLETIDKFSQNRINPNIISFLSLSPREAYAKRRGDDVIAALRETYKYDDTLQKNYSFDQYVDLEFERNLEYQDFLKDMTVNGNPINSDAKFNFESLKLLEEYHSLDAYKYTLFDHLKRIESTKFRMNYKIKFIESQPKYDEKGKLLERGKMVDLHYQMQNFQNIFYVEGDKRNFVLNFKSPLGKFIIHNTLIMDTDWCPVEAMTLSKNAYFLFKRFVLNRVSGKHKANTITLNFDDLKTYLGVSWSNSRAVHQMITKALTDMVEKGIVSSYQENRNHGRERTYELTFDHDAAGDSGDED